MFLDENFLLNNETARVLFHDYANKMPIIDYHCHLDPQEIYDDKCFRNITEAWLDGDHYKWRLMRANGVDESLITGNTSDYDKFMAFAQTIEKSLGNPVYIWSHLELKRYFNIDLLINEANANEIWTKVNEKLLKAEYSRRSFIKKSNVKVIGTTDDPIDDLNYHRLLKQEEKDFKVVPTFRPDMALNINSQNFRQWIIELEKINEDEINSFEDFLVHLEKRVDYFHLHDCRLSDHSLGDFKYVEASKLELDKILSKAINGGKLSPNEINKHVTATLLALLSFYNDNEWVMQLHLQATRNNSDKMLKEVGSDAGFDSINDSKIIEDLQLLFNKAQLNGALPKTILYSLNPNDYPVLLALMGSFQNDSIMRFQLGSAWWFNDTRTGMRKQLQMFADNSLLPHFVGMLTDSRSFLSYTRHEYFRRILCELIGEWVERGEAPKDYDYLGEIVEDISYNNANNYFGFKLL